jgi:hypothetical protein
MEALASALVRTAVQTVMQPVRLNSQRLLSYEADFRVRYALSVHPSPLDAAGPAHRARPSWRLAAIKPPA